MKHKLSVNSAPWFFFAYVFFFGLAYGQPNPLQGLNLPSNLDSSTINKAITSGEFLSTIGLSPIGEVDGLSSLGNKSRANPEIKKPMDLLIFVSASMSQSLLRDYSKQAKEIGAILVIRGFINGKSSETDSFILAVNEGGAEWMIHPGAFKLFKVTKAPTIVLADAGAGSVTENGCALETSYTKVSGDMTILSALDLFNLKSEPKFSVYARKIIADNQKKYEPKSIKGQ